MLRHVLLALLAILVACAPGGGMTRRNEAAAGLVGILVTPEEVVLPEGTAVQLVATGLYEDRKTRDLTAVVTWRSDDPRIAKPDGRLDHEGRIAAKRVGRTEVEARLGGVRSPPVKVRVTDQTVTELVVSPGEVVVGVGQEVQLTANATFSDGSSGDVTGLVRWITDDGSIATLEGGLLAGSGEGTTAVRAQYEELLSNDVAVEVMDSGYTSTWYAPDLAVDYVDVLYDGTWAYYEVELSNYGDTGTGPFWVDLYVDRWNAPQVGVDGDDWVEVAWIGAWDTKVIEFFVEANCDFGCTSWVFADSYDDIAEPWESDNLYGPLDVY